EVNDLLGALAYVQSRPDVDPQRIGAFGFSVGGQIALRAAGLTDRIKAVAADGSTTSTFEDEVPRISLWEWINFPVVWVYYQIQELLGGVPSPTSVMQSVQKIAPRPLLLISTGQDMEAREEARFYEAAGDPKALWNIPETGHGGGFAARPKEYAYKLV